MTDAYTVRIRASQAKMELRETGDAFVALRQAMVDELLGSPAQATEKREKLYQAINVLDTVKTALQRVIETGEIEKTVEEMTRRGDPNTPMSRPIPGVDAPPMWRTLANVGRKPDTEE